MATMTNPVHERIAAEIRDNDVVLYMKGSPVFPQCGFSAAVVQILSQLGVKFKGIDILVDPSLRQGIKEFSNWPTIPQLYVKGEFVGGCDIVREMFETGELAELLRSKGVAANAQTRPPTQSPSPSIGRRLAALRDFPRGAGSVFFGAFQGEGQLAVDPVFGDLAVLDRGLEILDVNRPDVLDRFRRGLDGQLRGVFPALVRLRQDLDDFDDRHVVLLLLIRSRNAHQHG